MSEPRSSRRSIVRTGAIRVCSFVVLLEAFFPQFVLARNDTWDQRNQPNVRGTRYTDTRTKKYDSSTARTDRDQANDRRAIEFYKENTAFKEALQEIRTLVESKNWTELARRSRTDRKHSFTKAFAHEVFRHPGRGEIYDLQTDATLRGSFELIKAIAESGFASLWTHSSGSYLRYDGNSYADPARPFHASDAALIKNVVMRFPESASFEVQRLIFDSNVAKYIPESVMRQFFARASREFLASRNANRYFQKTLSIGGLSTEQIQLIEASMRSGAKIYDAGTTVRTRLKYIDTQVVPSRAGGSCGNLFAAY